jgi:hypothetical protein
MAFKFTDKTDGLQFVLTNDEVFVGKYEKTETGYIVKDAVTHNGDFRETMKEWFQKSITNGLSELNMEGNGVTITTKNFSDDQKMEATIIAMQAERAANTAVNNLQASAVEEI